jgi:hypothetical protein
VQLARTGGIGRAVLRREPDPVGVDELHAQELLCAARARLEHDEVVAREAVASVSSAKFASGPQSEARIVIAPSEPLVKTCVGAPLT